jgi:hypothetical protein
MQVFIKASNISDSLGEEFSAFGSLTPEIIVLLNRFDLLEGFVLNVEENETKAIISPVNVKTSSFELNINKENQSGFTIENLANTTFRPRDGSGELIPLREEIFPQEKIEEIEEANTGYPILLDFLDKSIDFTIVDFNSEVVNEINTITKIAINGEEENAEVQYPFFISTEFFDQNGRILDTIVEIYDQENSAYYKISKEESSQDFKIKEYIYSDMVSLID